MSKLFFLPALKRPRRADITIHPEILLAILNDKVDPVFHINGGVIDDPIEPLGFDQDIVEMHISDKGWIGPIGSGLKSAEMACDLIGKLSLVVMQIKLPELCLSGNPLIRGNEPIKRIDEHRWHGLPFHVLISLHEKGKFH